MNEKNTAKTEALVEIGQALYGRQWQTDLSRALGLRDARRVRQWLSGDRPVPAGIWVDLEEILKQRQDEISSILKKLKSETR